MSMNRPFPVDASMTAIAIGYSNPEAEMLHKKVLPGVPALSERFTWMSFPIEEAFTLPELQVGRKSSPGLVEFTAQENEGSIKHYGLDDVIPITDIDEAKKAREAGRTKYNPEYAAVEGLTRLMLLGRERRASRIVQDPNNYDASRRLALAGTDRFSDFENSDPFEVLNAGMTKPLVYRANTVVMGLEVWEVIKRHPKLIKAAKGGLAEEGAISRAQLAELLEISPERLLIGASMVNLAAKGQDVSLARVWGKSIQMLHVDSTKSATTDGILTWGFTAEYEGRISGSIPAPNVGIKGGTQIRVGEMVEEVVCAKSLGYIIQNAIA